MQALQIRHVSPVPTVVGYKNYTLKEGLNLVAVQFNEIATSERATVDTMFANLKGQASASEFDDVADEILTYDDGEGYSGQNRFFYYYEGGSEEYDYHWIAEGGDEEGEVTTYKVAPGKGFFYWNRSGKEIATSNSGAVSPTQVTWTIVPNLNLLSNPFPVALPVDTLTDWRAAGAYASEYDDVADEILTYDDGEGYSGQNRFFFYYEGGSEEYDYHWIAEGGDEEGEVTTYQIQPGQGFFYWRRGAENMSITLTSPVAAK